MLDGMLKKGIEKFGNPILFTRQLTLYQQKKTAISKCNTVPTDSNNNNAAKKQQSNAQPFRWLLL